MAKATAKKRSAATSKATSTAARKPASIAAPAAMATTTATPRPGAAWTFLTNHSHVLLCLADDPAVRLRDVAVRVGITERAVQKIVADLEAGGVLTRDRDGRRNHYTIDARQPLRHPIESHRTVQALLDLLQSKR